ncbi:hypothetical protein DNK44_03920, partial [Pseudomonas dryadis]
LDNGVTVQVPVAPGQSNVEVSATITDPAGNSGSAHDDKPVDDQVPGVAVELQGAGEDGVYNAAEIGADGSVPALISLDDQVRVGDTLVVRDGDGQELLNRPVTQADLDNGVTVQVPVAPGQSNVEVSATITDPAGNSGSAHDDKPVDDLPPALNTALGDQADADADPVSLDLSGHFSDAVDGSALTFAAVGLPDGLSIDPATGVISGTIGSSASQGGDGHGEYPVTVTATDKAGNSTEASFTWRVDNPAPQAFDDSASTDEDTPLIVDAANGVLGNDRDVDGDNLSVTGFSVAGSDYLPGETADIAGVGQLTLHADGSYSFVPVADWHGSVPPVTYRISDGEGGTDSAVLNIGVEPVVDIAPDSDVVARNGSVLTSVLGNDGFSNADRVISATTAPANGTLQVNADGSIRYTPDADFVGSDSYTYTVTSGGVSETTTVTLTVIAVDIVDNASPAGVNAGNGDNVLASIDDLVNTRITGQAPAGASAEDITLVVSDGQGNSVTVPATAISLDAEGRLTASVDVSALLDGELSVTLTVQSPSGVAVSTSDVIGKDTVTEVSIDPLDVINGQTPGEITGKGEPGSTITLNIGDQQLADDILVDDNGDWRYTPVAPFPDGEGSLTAHTVDPVGNSNTAQRNVPTVSIVAPPDDVLGHVIVHEKGLANGSEPDSGEQIAHSTFTLGVIGDLQGIEVGGIGIDLQQLLDSATTPIAIPTALGLLQINGYAAATGEVSYTYTLHTPVANDSVQIADSAREDVAIRIIMTAGDSRSTTLTVAIIDDVPVAVDQQAVELDEGGVTVGTATGEDNLLQDARGADGARVHRFRYLDGNGDEQLSEVIGDGASLTVTTQFGGQLTVHSDGTWSYTSPPARDSGVAAGHGAPGSDSDEQLAADFAYQLIDGDGDLSDWATQPIRVNDTVPGLGTPENQRVEEKYLGNGSEPDAQKLVVSGALQVQKGADAITVGIDGAATIAALEALGLKHLGIDLSIALVDGRIEASAGGTPIFTLELTSTTSNAAGYTFTLHNALDHAPDVEVIDLPFQVLVTDADGDTAGAGFVVSVVDDSPQDNKAITLEEDGSVTFTTSADATGDNTLIKAGSEPAHGTVSVNPDGSITYVPNGNYSGTDTFTYTTVTDQSSSGYDVTVTVTVNPVADAPTLTVEAPGVTTAEDTAVALGLNAPQVTDALDQNAAADGDNPERLGLITLSGIPAGALLSAAADGASAAISHSATGAPITIVLSDGQHIADLSGQTLTMTTAQYQALMLLPPAESHANFTVGIEVTSYEVDAADRPLDGVAGATSVASVQVAVQAVTDPLELKIDGGDSHVVTIDEDSALDLASLLTVAYPNSDGNTTADVDGSEERWFEISGLPVGSQVNGILVTSVDQVVTIPAPGLSVSADQLPAIGITPPQNFSGDISGITVTLKGQDHDADGIGSGATLGAVVQDSVSLTLHVNPIADDIRVDDVETAEDTAVAFLAGVSVSDNDTATTGGVEIITKVEFEVPSGWLVTAPAATADWSASLNGSTYSIESTSAGYDLQDILGQFSILPPAHSSLDATLQLNITSQDSQTVNGTLVTDQQTNPYDLTISVRPVAETIGDGSVSDSDGNGSADLGMIGDHVYVTEGVEDTWFVLGQEDGFNLADPDAWFNEDGNESVFALLTPELIAGDGSQADAFGSQFQYSTDGGATWVVQTYGGDAIEVPLEYLGTLQFKAAADFSGMFRIGVQVKTVDYDDDHPGDLSRANVGISGAAELTNILIKPAADTVTTSITARVEGGEDQALPLSIRPSSSDPSEIFNVTLSGIPLGATITYGAQSFTATAGNTSWLLEDFDASLPMTVIPPLHSNETFTLQVSTVSVDTLVIPGDPGSPYSSTSAPHELTIVVAPKGVADPADIELSTDSFSEAQVDAAGGIALNQLIVNAALIDDDGSEVLTFKISGLPEGFAIEGATFIGGSGTSREWSLTQAQLASASLKTPANFNGTQPFDLYVVTTENDGDSLTERKLVEVRVSPSPEADITLSSSLQEDVPGRLDFSIVQRNGDTDEVLEAVWIKASDVDAASDFSLTFGANGGSLASAVANGESGIVLEDGWYKLTGGAIDALYAQGKANWHGSAGFAVRYLITDPAADASVTAVTEGFDGNYLIEVAPVTDQVTLAVTDGQQTTLSGAGTLSVGLLLGNENADYDGSEQLTRILIDNVPDGVVVKDAAFIGNGQWLMISSDAFDASLAKTIEFQVHGSAGGLSDHPIGITVVSQDAGNGVDSRATVTVSLSTDFPAGPAEQPAQILDWSQTSFEPSEDSPFSLDQAIAAQIEDGVSDNGFTVTLSDLPAGTQVSGMTLTLINGQALWTASGSGGDAELQALLQSIQVTPPANWNSNQGSFDYQAKLTTYVPSGSRAEAALSLEQAVLPVTDAADILISAPSVDEGGDLAIRIDIGNAADAPNWTLLDGTLYLQLVEPVAMQGGELKDAQGNVLSLSSVSGVPGLADGDYYVVTAVAAGTPLDLVYTPRDAHVSGSIGLVASVRGQEAGSTLVQTTTVTGQGSIAPVDSGYDFTVADSVGHENPTANDKTQAIRLDISDSGLVDADGSESVSAILLKNLPNDFLVYVGTSAADAELASLANNAGGSGTNTWLLGSVNGGLPPYIAILPPKHWSGTLEGLQLVVISGETAAGTSTSTSQDFSLSVTPVADGISLTPTPSFGKEGEIIQLNLNAEIKDLRQAGSTDASTESATLQLKGLGEHAAFYLDAVLIDMQSRVSYDADEDVYTIDGLSPDDIDRLGFVQALSDIGTLEVRARTVESAAPDAPSAWSDWSAITTNINAQYGTTGNDRLLWTGAAINGRGTGDTDTIQLRYGESLAGSELAARLDNIEVIDLSIGGANAITGLSIQDVLDITDARNTLRILGDSEDSLSLGSGWELTGNNAGYAVYSGALNGVTATLEVAMPLID